jgi:hypothetical protein
VIRISGVNQRSDFYRLQTVENISCSKDGEWIAYTVTAVDRRVPARTSRSSMSSTGAALNWFDRYLKPPADGSAR